VSLTEDALATAFRTGLPFVGLRDHAHDPDLDRLIPPDAARAARAIPLTADDDRIRLAVADPDTDLSTLDKYLAGRQVDLALAPREEIDTILGPPPPPGEEEPEDLADGSEALATEEPEPVPAEADGPEPLTEVEPEPDRLAAAEDAEPTEATPSESAPEPAGETEPQSEPLAVEPDPFAARPETDGVAEPEPVATDVAGTEVEPGAQPDPLAAGPEAASATDLAGTEVEPRAQPVPLTAGPETDRAAGPEPVAGEEAATGADAPSEPEPFAAQAAPEPVAAVAPADGAALSDSDAELDGELPSWLEPRRRRWWRVLLAVLLVLVVLAAAAVAVVALVNA
jgi:MshEN domain